MLPPPGLRCHCLLLTFPFKMSPMRGPGKVWCRRLGCAFRMQGLDQLLSGSVSVCHQCRLSKWSFARGTWKTVCVHQLTDSSECPRTASLTCVWDTLMLCVPAGNSGCLSALPQQPHGPLCPGQGVPS